MAPSEQGSSLSRRGLLAAGLSSGFALAVQPVAAEAIHTPSAGLETAEVQIPSGQEALPAYVARPKGKGLPTVLVVHEIFGVHEHIKDVCRRLAQQGYFAIAPELFVRQGDVSKAADVGGVRQIVDRAADAQVLADLDATVQWARQGGVGDVTKLGITGFCWGGRIVWLYAAHSSALKAGVAWYGRLSGDENPLRPKHPLDVAATLKAPVLGLYGAEDSGIPLASVEAMKQALASGPKKSSSRQSEFKVYAGAPHAFFADYRPSYRKTDAEDGWQRLLAWFKRNGVA